MRVGQVVVQAEPPDRTIRQLSTVTAVLRATIKMAKTKNQRERLVGHVSSTARGATAKARGATVADGTSDKRQATSDVNFNVN